MPAAVSGGQHGRVLRSRRRLLAFLESAETFHFPDRRNPRLRRHQLFFRPLPIRLDRMTPLTIHALLDELRRGQGRAFSKLEILLQLTRSEEHTSELQSRGHLVCRLLLE